MKRWRDLWGRNKHRMAYNQLLTVITAQLRMAEPPWEANIFLAIQEIPHVSCNLMTISATQNASVVVWEIANMHI